MGGLIKGLIKEAANAAAARQQQQQQQQQPAVGHEQPIYADPYGGGGGGASPPPAQQQQQQPPVAAATATAVNNGDGDGDADCKQIPLCYSPLQYWLKFVVGSAFCIMNGVYIKKYYVMCSDAENFSPSNVWYILLSLFWGIQGLCHGVFIVHRYRNKVPVTPNVMYDGPLERGMKLPLTVDLLLVVAMCIWGFFLVKTNPCSGHYNGAVQFKSILYLIFSVSLLMLMYGLKRK